jgi:hypothetical protein
MSQQSKKTQQRPPITVTVNEAMRLSGLGETTLYAKMRDGTLEVAAVGARRLIVFASLQRLLAPTERKPIAHPPIPPRRRGRPRKIQPEQPAA